MFLRSEPWSACPNPLIQLVGSAAEALTSCKAHEDPFDLILLDYELSDGNADVSLPAIRAALGEFASVVMLSSVSREPTLQQCLSLGADAYRVKPIFSSSLLEMLTYATEKRRFLSDLRSRPPTPQAGPSFRIIDSTENALAHGRRTAVHLGARAILATPVVIKPMPLEAVRGNPPPAHPHVNRVLERVIEHDRCFELRELCNGGEFFDVLFNHPEGCSPRDSLHFAQQVRPRARERTRAPWPLNISPRPANILPSIPGSSS